jgi:Raf kinase inhibitor-like YbhB/YbcL family protein
MPTSRSSRGSRARGEHGSCNFRSMKPTQRGAGSLLAACALSLLAHACHEASGSSASTLVLTSSNFLSGAEMSAKHTCDGVDVSPPLSWSGAPVGTRSYALVMDDADAPPPLAPKSAWVHWVIYDIPPNVKDLPEHVTEANLLPHARAGKNDWSTLGYRGPCPPFGRHRYAYTLYALDTVLHDLGDPDAPSLQRAMRGHVLGQTTLIGTYAKKPGR